MTFAHVMAVVLNAGGLAFLALNVWWAGTCNRRRRQVSRDEEKAARLLDQAEACYAQGQAYLNEARWRGAGQASRDL